MIQRYTKYEKTVGLMIAGVLLPCSMCVGQDTLDVPEDYPSLQEALAVVAEGDVIRIAPGTYDAGNGDALPCVSFTIQGSNNPEDTILTGSGLNFGACEATRYVENLTLREMTMYGAIEVRDCVTVIDSVRLMENSSHGFFVTDGGHLQATNSVFGGNLARGGYAYVNGFFTADGCEFIGNGYCDCYGGGFAAHVGSGCAITNTLFKENNANAGGAIGLSFSGSRTFTDCVFEGNTANDGSVWWTEFGACGTLIESRLCGHSEDDLSGCWSDGGGNQFLPAGCDDGFIDVPEDYPSLQEALAVVAHGDIIRIAPGTYDVGNGDPLPCVSFTIQGSNNPEDTILTGSGLNFGACEATRYVENLTLREMTMYGAIEVRDCVTVIDSVRLMENSSHGFFVTDGGHLQATNSVFGGNLARGGYAYVNGFFTADGCEFIGNGYCDCYGGGFAAHVGSGCAITNTLFKENNANAGGAIGLSFSGSRTFTDCVFEGNTANDGSVWWTEFGACGTLIESRLCGHSEDDLSGCWSDGGGNEFFPSGCLLPCPSDINGNGFTDGEDLGLLFVEWGACGGCSADLDGNGAVDGQDIGMLLTAWGPCGKQ